MPVPLVKKKPRKRNKDGTWRKKRSDTGKKRGENMSEQNARDTQFRGFAVAVFLEQEALETEGLKKGWNKLDVYRRQRALLMRRAYDFAVHIIDNSRSNDMEDWETKRIMPYVPDMTELPKETREDDE